MWQLMCVLRRFKNFLMTHMCPNPNLVYCKLKSTLIKLQIFIMCFTKALPITDIFNQYFVFSTAWHNQPYSLGSYTSIGVGGQQNDIERLAEPMFQRPNNRTVTIKTSSLLQQFCDYMLLEKKSLDIRQINLFSLFYHLPENIVTHHSFQLHTELISLVDRPPNTF